MDTVRRCGEGKEGYPVLGERMGVRAIKGDWTEVQSCPLASIFIGKKTGPQIRNGRTNIIKRKLKSQIGEVKESV